MPLSPDRRQPVRRLYAAVAALIAAGYGLTLVIFYPGIMTYDAKFVYEDIGKGVLGDWQSPVMTVLWGMIDPVAPGAASMFLLIATSYWLAFGLLAFALARRGARLALLLPAAGAAAAGLRVCRNHLARRAVRDELAARGGNRFRCRRERRTPSLASASRGACAVRLRRPAAPERADRRADPRRLHCVADANIPQAHGDPVRPGDGGLFCAGAGGLLRRARRDAATSAAVDHGVRSRRYQPLRQGEPVSGRLERARDGSATERLLPADPMGHLLAARALRVRDGQDRTGAEAVRYARHHRGLAACGHAPPGGVSAPSRSVHVEFPRRRQPHHVGRRRRASVADRVCRTVRPSPRWFPCTTGSSRRRCFGPARGYWFASSCADSPGGGATRPRAPLRSVPADRPRSMC